MNHILHTFPLLEETAAVDLNILVIDPSLVHARINWLIRASRASQADFALQILAEEPEHGEQEESFHATLATVLTMDEEIKSEWLRLEMAVAAKKVDTNVAFLNKLFVHYRIAKSRQQKDGCYEFKFPHQDEWTEVKTESELPSLLASAAFPLLPVVTVRYSRVKRDAKAVRLVEEAIKGHAANKRVKTSVVE